VSASGAIQSITDLRAPAFYLPSQETRFGDFTGATSGQTLVWNATTGKFEASDPGEIALQVADLTDIVTTGVQDGYTFRYDAALGKFVVAPLQITGEGGSAGDYAVVDRIQIVDGAEITISAGITTIQSDANLLPELTDYDATVDARISVSSTYSSSFPKWKALTAATGTYDTWHSLGGINPAVTPQWWQYTFPSAVLLGRLIYSSRSQFAPSVGHLKDFKIQNMSSGSPVDLLTVNDLPLGGGTGATPSGIALATATSLVSFRIWVSEVYPNTMNASDWVTTIANLKAFSQTTNSSGLGSISGGFTRARKAILAGIAISGNNAFIPCGFAEGTDKIFRIDTATKSINGDFSLGATQIYSVGTVSSSVGGSFSFSVQKNQQAAPIVAAPGNKVYIAIGSEIRVYSSTNGNLIKTIDCGIATEIQGLGISIEQNKIYGASKAGAIVVIDTGTDTLSKTLTATDDAAYGGNNYAVAVDDSRDACYVTSRSTNKVLCLNTITDTLVTTINVGSTPEGIAISPILGKAITCNRTANTVSIINTTNNTVGASIAMSNVGSGAEPTAAAIDEATGKAAVCLYTYHQVAIIDLATSQIEGRAATSLNPQQAVFVPSTNEIFVASEGGDLTIIART
jgi:YVTN family beta-propeller protein